MSEGVEGVEGGSGGTQNTRAILSVSSAKWVSISEKLEHYSRLLSSSHSLSCKTLVQSEIGIIRRIHFTARFQGATKGRRERKDDRKEEERERERHVGMDDRREGEMVM